MTTQDLHRIEWTTARPEENSSFVAFVDACFGLPAGGGLRWTFPVALGAANAAHQYSGWIEGRRVCAATAVVRDWSTSEGLVRAACVGCFSTDPAFRGRGLSAALQQHLLERLSAEGVQWAALWTDRPELYEHRGFVAAGSEHLLWLDGVSWPRMVPTNRIRVAGPDDAAALLDLHRTHRWRVERSVEDVRAHLDPRTSLVWLLEEAGVPRAYVALEKGIDFAGHVADFAGDVAAVQVLLGRAHREGIAAVIVPQGAEAHLTGPASAARRQSRPCALVRTLAAGPDPRRCAWSVGGFDSA